MLHLATCLSSLVSFFLNWGLELVIVALAKNESFQSNFTFAFASAMAAAASQGRNLVQEEEDGHP